MNITVICKTQDCQNYDVPVFFAEEADMYVCGACMNEITNKVDKV